jgi:DNA-binding transcriptional regulator YbjK
LADQLGKRSALSDYYEPLQAPGQMAWVELLQGEPLLILLDELPPYLSQARSRIVGNSDLAKVTTAALANLLAAVSRPELDNVCVVISDLESSYDEGSDLIKSAFKNLENEVGRLATYLEPVKQNSTEVYDILRQKLFAEMPAQDEIEAVGEAYATAVEEAKQMDVTDASPRQYARKVEDAFPFHFSMRDLYARFKENQGFQETRDLIKLMRAVVRHLWESGRAEEISLVHPYDLDLNHSETFSKVSKINAKLENAVSSDVASGGTAVAETIDDNRGGRDAEDLATLLLVASLPEALGGQKGLGKADLFSYLCRPGRDISKIEKEVFDPFYTRAIYLHGDSQGKLLFKDVKNVVAQVRDAAKSYNKEARLLELRSFLAERFAPHVGDVYQRVQVLPPVDEIEDEKDKVTLVLDEPTRGGGLSPDLERFYKQATNQNRLLFLTGQRGGLESLLEESAKLKGIKKVIEEMRAENMRETDPQFVSAQEIAERTRFNLLSAARETFTTLLFPYGDLRRADFHMNFDGNTYDGEEQIRQTLKQNRKFTTDVESETFQKKCEKRLFTRKEMDWKEVKRKAATQTRWPFHDPGALDYLKDRLVREGKWREAADGYVKKGPFAKEKTTVRVSEKRRRPDGTVQLSLTPVHGTTIYYEVRAEATPSSALVEAPDEFETSEMRVSFICVDESGAEDAHETGDAVTWENDIEIRNRQQPTGGGKVEVELEAAPDAQIKYTTDGSNPKLSGGIYDGTPFEVNPSETRFVMAVAESKGISSGQKKIRVREQGIQINPEAPLLWKTRHQMGTTKETYDFLDRVERFGAEVQGLTLGLTQNGEWAEVSFHPEMRFSKEKAEESLRHLRTFFDGGEAEITVQGILFEAGRDFNAWVKEEGKDISDLSASEIVQPEEKGADGTSLFD